jgi:hypothetical protein
MRFWFALVMMLALSMPAMAQTPSFARDIDDLPIMAGLTDTGEGYVFQIASGRRLAETRLRGTLKPNSVEVYYQSVLPRLGWTASPGQSRTYTRGSETLRLVFGTAADGATVVRVLLAPKA